MVNPLGHKHEKDEIVLHNGLRIGVTINSDLVCDGCNIACLHTDREQVDRIRKCLGTGAVHGTKGGVENI